MLALFGGARRDRDQRSAGREASRDGLADASAGACHDRHSALETAHVRCPPVYQAYN
jgi:hypothetical protein